MYTLFGYIDPMAGTIGLQIILALIVGLWIRIRGLPSRIQKLVRRRGRTPDSNTGDEAR